MLKSPKERRVDSIGAFIKNLGLGQKQREDWAEHSGRLWFCRGGTLLWLENHRRVGQVQHPPQKSEANVTLLLGSELHLKEGQFFQILPRELETFSFDVFPLSWKASAGGEWRGSRCDTGL